MASRKDSSEFSTSWWKLKTALYGSTTVSETFGDGITEKVSMMRSGYLGCLHMRKQYRAGTVTCLSDLKASNTGALSADLIMLDL